MQEKIDALARRISPPAAAVLGLIAIVSIVVLLNYFDMVSLSSKNFGFLPKANKPDTAVPVPAPASIDPNSAKGSIVAASLENNYLLFLTEEEELQAYFEQFGIWGKRYNEKVQKDTLPVTKTLIFLSDNRNQVVDYKDATGKHHFSYSLSFNNDILTITIYLPPDALSSPTASEAFSVGVIYALSGISGTPLALPAGPKLFQITKTGQLPSQNSSLPAGGQGSPSAN